MKFKYYFGVLLLLSIFLPTAWSRLSPYSRAFDSEVCSCRPIHEKCSLPSFPSQGKHQKVRCLYPMKPCCSPGLLAKPSSLFRESLESKESRRLSKRDASQMIGPSPGKSAIKSSSKTCSCVPSNQCEDENLDFTFGESCGFGMVRCCVVSRGVQLPYNIVHQESFINSSGATTTTSSPAPVFNPSKTQSPGSVGPPKVPVIKVTGSQEDITQSVVHLTKPEYQPGPFGNSNTRPERQTSQGKDTRLVPGQVITLPHVPRFPLPGKPISFPRHHRRPSQAPQPGTQVALPHRPRPELPLQPGQPTSLSRQPRPPFPGEGLQQPPFGRPSPLLKKTHFNPQEPNPQPPQRRRPPPPPQRLSPEAMEELRKREAAKRAFFENQRRHQEQMLQKRRLERLKKKRPSTKETSTLENLATIFQRFFG